MGKATAVSTTHVRTTLAAKRFIYTQQAPLKYAYYAVGVGLTLKWAQLDTQ